jgi:molecular chaperone GrpE
VIPNSPSDFPEDQVQPEDADQSAAEDAAQPGKSDAETMSIDQVMAAQGAGPAEPQEDLGPLLDDTRNRLLRTQAELENFRKRSRRELEDANRYASVSLMRDLLPVLDNLNRAIEAAEKNESAVGLLDGVKMVAEQFGNVLKQHHCVPIDADGERFDPNVHEAMAQLPSEDHTAGSVMSVTQTGYMLHDRVVRPAQVIVAAPSSPAPTGDNVTDDEFRDN